MTLSKGYSLSRWKYVVETDDDPDHFDPLDYWVGMPIVPKVL